MGRGSARFGDEGRRQGARPFIRPGAREAPRPCPCRRPSLLSVGGGESHPRRRPLRGLSEATAFYNVFGLSHFSALAAQDGSTWPNIGPNNAGNACRTGVLRLHRGRMLG